MKKRVFFAFVLGLIVLLCACGGGGKGRRRKGGGPESMPGYKNPQGDYEVYDAEQLAWIAAKVNAGDTNEFPNDDKTVVRLMNDLDFRGSSFPGIGVGDNAPYFNGTFDGGGFLLENISVYAPGVNRVGFIGKTSSTAVVRNIRFKNANTGGNFVVGIVVGDNSGIIERCGTGGGNADATANRGSVTGIQHLGAIAGQNRRSGTVRECYNTATVIVPNSTAGAINSVAGIVGFNDNGIVENSYNLGKVINRTSMGVGGLGGGIVGFNSGTVRKCYGPKSLSGVDISSGVVHENSSSLIINQASIDHEKDLSEGMLKGAGYDWDFVNVWENRAGKILLRHVK